MEVSGSDGLDAALRAGVGAGINAIVVLGSPDLSRAAPNKLIADFAAANRLPAIAPFRWFAEAGGLLSYGVNFEDFYPRAGGFVVRILKGAKPGDLAIELPSKFELVVNRKTAKALGPHDSAGAAAARGRGDSVNRRRALRFAIGAGVSARALPLWAQTSAVALRRVGVLAPSTRAKEEVTLKPFFDEMRQLGWIEGQTIAYDRAYADDRHQDLPRLAAELVARKPELIYAPPQVAAVAARQATHTIPIVFATGTDPVGAGLVSSLARPLGNATGVVSVVDSLAPKRVELLREILPGAKRIGLLGDPKDPRLALDRNALVPVADALGLTIIVAEASNPVEFDAAVARLLGEGVDAILAVTSISSNLRHQLVELANRKRVPVVRGQSRNWPMPGPCLPTARRWPINCAARPSWWTRCSRAPSRPTLPSSSRPGSSWSST